MAVRLKCANCQDDIVAAESDRGMSIKCGTCWADVPVPLAESPPAPPAQPVMKAVPLPPASGPVVAKALPLPSDSAPVVATALPTAAPVARPAVPAKLNPVGEKTRRSDRDDYRSDRRDDRDDKRPKFKNRDRDDDDDRPTRTASGGGGGKGVLIAFLCLGLVVLVGAGVAVVVLWSSGGNNDTVSTDTPLQPIQNPVNPFGGGGDNVVNNQPKPIQPGKGDFNPNELFPGNNNPKPAPVPRGGGGNVLAGWGTFSGAGFSLKSPAKMVKDTSNFAYAGKSFSGSKYEANEGSDLEVHAWELGLQDGANVTTAEFVGRATFNVEENIQKSEIRPMPHGDATVFNTKEINFENGTVLVTTTPDKVFVFRIRWKNKVADGGKKRDDFLTSIRLLNAPVVNNLPNNGDPFGPKRGGPAPIAAAWKAVENKGGFTAEAPGGVAKEKQTVELENKVLASGTKYTASDEACNYWLFHHDIPADRDDLMEKIARKLVHDVFPHEVNNSEAGKLDGKEATKWTIRHFHGGLSTGYSVKLGFRVFTFFVTSKQGIYQLNGDPTLVEREKKFFAAIKLPFDPKTFDPYADEGKWVAMVKTNGFGVLVPKNATELKDKPVGFGVVAELVQGKEYVTSVDGISYTVTVHTATPKLSADKIAAEIRGRENVRTGPDKVKVNGLTFDSYELTHFFGHPILFRATAVGNTVYTLRVVRSEAFGKQVGEKEFADKAAKFLESFRLGIAVVDGAAPEAAGAFVQLAAGKVKPFWSAAVLPRVNELITVGVRDPLAAQPGGILRRYSIPDFKLKGTYSLNLAAHRVAADERGGKLYVAMVAGAADAKLSEREAAIVSGEIQVIDLKKLLEGGFTELEVLKPTNTLNVGGTATQVSGMKVSPLGDAVYVSCVQTAGTKAKPVLRGKLIKYDTIANKSTDLTCEAPVWGMDLSADGKQLAIVERPLPAMPGRGGNLVLIDAPGWRRQKAVPLSGDPLDVTFVGTRAAALESKDGALKATMVEPDGESSELALAGDVRYLKATPDGKKLLVSSGLPSNGLMLFAADAAKPPKWAMKVSAQDITGTALGGLVTISPDGKMAILNAGVVLDLTK